jgi:hypothetical protein
MTAADGPDDLDDFVAEQMKDPLFAAQYRAAQLGAELQRLRQQVGAVWALHVPYGRSGLPGKWCPACGDDKPWPCETIRALCSALADVPAETPDDAAGEAS